MRPGIELIIEQYERSRKSVPVQKRKLEKARKRLEKLRQTAGKVREQLVVLNADNDVVLALSAARDPKNIMRALLGMEQTRKELGAAARNLEEVANWCANARRRVRGPQKGPSTRDARRTVHELCELFERFTDKPISRSINKNSPKDYVITVCEIADLPIGPGTIDGEMKAYINRRRGRNRQ